MKLLIILSLLIGSAYAAKPKTAQITQPEDQLRMEGVGTPAEELNTAPAPVPRNGDADLTPTITDEKPMKKQKQEEPEIMDEEEEP